MPTGIFSAPFAAQALAASGIVVLQASDCSEHGTASEIPCELDDYRAAIAKLVSEGVADPNRVGIIGFSRTSIYTLAALEDTRQRFAAAVINDGFMNTYTQYVNDIDFSSNFVEGWMNAMEGGPPIGESILNWVRMAPGFRAHLVRAPVRFEAVGRPGLLFMWEPYSILRYLRRPADMIVYQQGTHPLSNPRQRQMSEQGTVDWFRFWLQGYEDPDPVEREQYARWEHLCDQQVETVGAANVHCVRSLHR